MKSQHATLSLFLLPFLILGANSANATTLIIKGKDAKQIYQSLTGSDVQQEGAAGHSYSKGTSILCRYTNADMTNNGKTAPPKAPCRYTCSINFNQNGLASPGSDSSL